MNSKEIQRYKGKTVAQLLKIATKHFNTYIRHRDAPDGFGCCISSGSPLNVPSANAQAGHFYSAGKYPELRYNEDNVHLQGKSDNYFNGGNLLEYRKNLIKKIGLARVEKLDWIAEQSKKQSYKWDRYYIIETIIKYKNK